jgi:hypothetical protein
VGTMVRIVFKIKVVVILLAFRDNIVTGQANHSGHLCALKGYVKEPLQFGAVFSMK